MTADSSMKRYQWWIAFGVATFVMSRAFQTFRVFTVTPTLVNGLLFVGCLVLLTVAVGVLVYDSYVQEKVKGTVQHAIPLFEWIMARRRGSSSPQSSIRQGGS